MIMKLLQINNMFGRLSPFVEDDHRNNRSVHLRRGQLLFIFLILLLLPARCFAQKGSEIDDTWLSRNYVKREVMIPMRDGVRLYTAIYSPSDSFKGPSTHQSESAWTCGGVSCGAAGHVSNGACGVSCGACSGHPIMMVRTPYAVSPYGESFGIRGDMLNYAAEGYIIVYQNVRGRYLSEGEFENVRPLSKYSANLAEECGESVDSGNIGSDGCTSGEVDEATDCYDTVEWLLRNTENNGKVGIKGVSYNGFYAMVALLSRHPAIVAVSPQAPVTDWFMGDDIHHNGVLCLADACGFGSSMFRDRDTVGTSAPGALVKPVGSLYDFYIDKPASYWTDFFSGRLRFWTAMCENTIYNEFWRERDPSTHLSGIKAAVLVTGGLYDAEDCYGVFRTYNSLKSLSPECDLYLALGPWSHGGWNDLKYNHLSGAWFGENSSAYYRDKIEFPFFQHYLSGSSDCCSSSSCSTVSRGNPACCSSSSCSAVPSGDTLSACRPTISSGNSSSLCSSTVVRGSNSSSYSNSASISPIPKVMVLPSSETMKESKAGVSTDSLWHIYPSWPPTCERTKFTLGESNTYFASERDSFISDPDNPVPYMATDASRRDKSYMAADQSFASSRTDVLTFTGPDIAAPLHIAGPVKVSLNLQIEVVDSLKNKSVDADIVVKLIDVRPDGYQMLVRGDVMPLRFRNGFDAAVPTENGSTVHLEFEMCDIDHIFERGHSLAVQIQGSCFPLFAVNRQNFTPAPLESSISDGQKLKISILDGSHLELGVVK